MDIAIVYPVAGMCSRYGSLKYFVEIGEKGETLIEVSLKQALPAGFTKIVFIVGERTEAEFKKRFGEKYQGIPIKYAHQNYDKTKRDKPWGTADALCSAKEFLDCPFVFCNADDLYGTINSSEEKTNFETLVHHLKNSKEDATIGYKLDEVLEGNSKANRAIFILLGDYVLKLNECLGISRLNLQGNKLENLCSMSIFALHPQTLNYLGKKVEEFKRAHAENRKIECFLPNEINGLIQERKIKMKIYPATGKWMGITYPGDEKRIREKLINKK